MSQVCCFLKIAYLGPQRPDSHIRVVEAVVVPFQRYCMRSDIHHPVVELVGYFVETSYNGSPSLWSILVSHRILDLDNVRSYSIGRTRHLDMGHLCRRSCTLRSCRSRWSIHGATLAELCKQSGPLHSSATTKIYKLFWLRI